MKMVVSVSDVVWGGKHQYMFDLCEGLVELGHDVTVIAEHGGTFSETCRRAGLPVVEVGSFANDPEEASTRYQELERPAVLVLSGRADLAALAPVAVAPTLRVFFRHSAFPLNDGPTGMDLLADVDLLVTTAEVQRRLQFDGLRDDPRFVKTLYMMLRSGITEKFLQEIERVDRVSVREGLGCDEDDIVLLSASRLSWEKDIAGLIDAVRGPLKIYPRLRLIIAGSGPEQNELAERVERYGLSGRVSFLGHRDDIPALLAASDVLLFSSAVPETGPLILKEAMAAGVPIIASNVGGVGEFIEHEQNGLLVKDIASFSSAIERLISEPETRARLGRNASVMAREQHRFEERVVAFSCELDLLALRSPEVHDTLSELDWDDVRLREEKNGGFLFVPRTSNLSELQADDFQAVRRALRSGSPVQLVEEPAEVNYELIENLYRMGAMIRPATARRAIARFL
uniref:Glycosyl transferase family 1 n=1 Tax=Rathayibacter sp. FH 236 TaxID=2615183 RepID=A0A5J6SIU5_9MICO|nr:glycosyl transferase family 1 [Rathayibacter sp. FH 236]